MAELNNNKIMEVLIFLTRFTGLLAVLEMFALLNYSIMNYVVIENIFDSKSYSTSQLRMFQYLANVLYEIGIFVFVSFSICFLAWFSYAYKVLKKHNKANNALIGASLYMWFVPILNFFVPFIMFKYLFVENTKLSYQNNEKPSFRFSPSILTLWWASLWIFIILTFLSTYFYSYFLFIDLSYISIARYFFGFIAIFLWYDLISMYQSILNTHRVK